MKKIICYILTLSILFSFVSMCSYAEPEKETNSRKIIYYPGYYVVIELLENENASSPKGTVTHTAYATAFANNNTSACILSLTAKFSVNNGVSVTCTSATYSTTIYDSSWSIVSPSASRSGATATATGTAKKKVLGITTTTIPLSISITCDKYGNISTH